MERNLKGYVTNVDENGAEQTIAVPLDCACGAPAVYGVRGAWLCTACYLAKPLFSSPTGAFRDVQGAA